MFRPLFLARVFFVILVTACGYWITSATNRSANTAVLSMILGLMVVLFEYSLRTVSTKHLVLSSVGLIFGLVVSGMVYQTIPETLLQPNEAHMVTNLFFGYLGVVILLKHADQINLNSFRFIMQNPEETQTRLLDTSVIIDGRVEQLLEGGFLPGLIICPSFVIDELQTLADCGETLKRGKGRRGLEILKSIQDKVPNLQIMEKDYPDIKDVDHKLLEMGREMGAQVVTNDANLQRVADLHQVAILNINELANMLRPNLFVGESFGISISRQGKERGQGVGYLPDGTMVVVDDADHLIGKDISVTVTSILQTNTGRMIFANPVDTDI